MTTVADDVVAKIQFRPGLVADDGRCLSGRYEVFINKWGGKGWWDDAHVVADSKDDALAICERKGWKVVS